MLLPTFPILANCSWDLSGGNWQITYWNRVFLFLLVSTSFRIRIDVPKQFHDTHNLNSWILFEKEACWLETNLWAELLSKFRTKRIIELTRHDLGIANFSLAGSFMRLEKTSFIKGLKLFGCFCCTDCYFSTCTSLQFLLLTRCLKVDILAIGITVARGTESGRSVQPLKERQSRRAIA